VYGEGARRRREGSKKEAEHLAKDKEKEEVFEKTEKLNLIANLLTQVHACPHSLHGCPFTSPSASDISTHLDSCAYKTLSSLHYVN